MNHALGLKKHKLDEQQNELPITTITFTSKPNLSMEESNQSNVQETTSSDTGGSLEKVDNGKNSDITCLDRWSKLSDFMMKPFLTCLVACARVSVKYPLTTVLGVTILSIALFFVGVFTNFYVETNNSILWTPTDSPVTSIRSWVRDDAGFPEGSFRYVTATISAKGKNVLTVEGAKYMFDVIDIARSNPKYVEFCQAEDGSWNYPLCPVESATGFWEDHSREEFEASVSTDEDVRLQMTPLLYADRTPVNRFSIFGRAEPSPEIDELRVELFLALRRQNITIGGEFTEEDIAALYQGLLEKYEMESAQAFNIILKVSYDRFNPGKIFEMETELTYRILELKENMANDPLNTYDFTIDVLSARGSANEVIRGMIKDAPLIGLAFVIMIVFCSYALSKPDKVKSQSLLGVGSVFTIGISIAAGYGIMFIFGVPLTTLTFLLPFALLGIGLDDMFIITGGFERTDPNKDVVERTVETIEEVGGSITVSSITTVVAYILGSIFSSMPGVKWFCIYAFTVIFVDFVFQLTFFIAIIGIDDRRIKANRYDCCICFKSSKVREESNVEASTAEDAPPTLGTRIMDKYSDFILKPASKVMTIVLFLALLVVGCYYASKITMELDARDLVPEDSFINDYFKAVDEYAGGSEVNFNIAYLCFRDEDFSDPVIHEQMHQYVDEMVAMPYVSNPPFAFWLEHFDIFLRTTKNETLLNSTFNEQIASFLDNDFWGGIHKNDVVVDETGSITASRTRFVYDQVSTYDIQEQLGAFVLQNEIAQNQTINDGSPFGKFFSYSHLYGTWEVWSILGKEITVTVALGLLAVFIVSMIFVKHPVSACILSFVVMAVFIEMVAVYHLSGLAINALTTIGLITCLGLVVDYSIHVCLSYFEASLSLTRNERAKHVLMTMGKSVLFGGFTTFLGVVPLAFNKSFTFKTMFITFVTITVLGLMHGLILVPVLLTYTGPDVERKEVESTQVQDEEKTG